MSLDCDLLSVMHTVHDLVDDGHGLVVDGAGKGLEVTDGVHVLRVQTYHLQQFVF